MSRNVAACNTLILCTKCSNTSSCRNAQYYNGSEHCLLRDDSFSTPCEHALLLDLIVPFHLKCSIVCYIWDTTQVIEVNRKAKSHDRYNGHCTKWTISAASMSMVLPHCQHDHLDPSRQTSHATLKCNTSGSHRISCLTSAGLTDAQRL